MKIPELPPLTKYDVVEVYMLDHHTPKNSGWMSSEDYAKFKDQLLVMKASGLYIDHDDNYLRICTAIDTDDEEKIGTFAILIGSIQQIHKLRRV